MVETDPKTRQRVWFALTDFEKDFLNIPVKELEELVVAANYLDVKRLLLFGCQALAALIKDKSPEEIRAIFDLEDDQTEDEKKEIRRKYPWCLY